MGLKAGTETGSLVNHLMSRTTSPAPVVGMGATVLGWTDRHPGTVVKVSASGKTVTVQEDDAKRTDGNGFSESQTYEYTRNEQGRVWTFRLGKGGWRGPNKGAGLLLGHREKYHDFSF